MVKDPGEETNEWKMARENLETEEIPVSYDEEIEKYWTPKVS